MSDRVQNGLSAVLVVIAGLMGVVLVHREFFTSQPKLAASAVYVADWGKSLTAAIPIGDTVGTIKLIVFSDLECPVCRNFDRTLEEFRVRHRSDVATYFVHYPLASIHRFARPAARAAECADREGRFAAFIAATYAKQDSLGLRSWTRFARDAEIQDTARFLNCVADTATIPRIDAGVALAKQFGAPGTPTIIFAGWRLPAVPDLAELERITVAIKQNRHPFASETQH